MVGVVPLLLPAMEVTLHNPGILRVATCIGLLGNNAAMRNAWISLPVVTATYYGKGYGCPEPTRRAIGG